MICPRSFQQVVYKLKNTKKQISVGKHVIQEVVKKPKTLHLDKKRHDAERIDHDNIRLLQKITKVSSTIPKIKLDKDWSLHKSYKRIVEKSGRKDLNDLFSRRKEFLEKNFQGMLPGIVKDSSRSREDVYSKNNGVLSDSKYNHLTQDTYSARTNSNMNGSLYMGQHINKIDSLDNDNNEQATSQEVTNINSKRTQSSGLRILQNRSKLRGAEVPPVKNYMQRTNFSNIQQKSKEDDEEDLQQKNLLNSDKKLQKIGQVNNIKNLKNGTISGSVRYQSHNNRPQYSNQINNNAVGGFNNLQKSMLNQSLPKVNILKQQQQQINLNNSYQKGIPIVVKQNNLLQQEDLPQIESVRDITNTNINQSNKSITQKQTANSKSILNQSQSISSSANNKPLSNIGSQNLVHKNDKSSIAKNNVLNNNTSSNGSVNKSLVMNGLVSKSIDISKKSTSNQLKQDSLKNNVNVKTEAAVQQSKDSNKDKSKQISNNNSQISQSNKLNEDSEVNLHSNPQNNHFNDDITPHGDIIQEELRSSKMFENSQNLASGSNLEANSNRDKNDKSTNQSKFLQQKAQSKQELMEPSIDNYADEQFDQPSIEQNNQAIKHNLIHNPQKDTKSKSQFEQSQVNDKHKKDNQTVKSINQQKQAQQVQQSRTSTIAKNKTEDQYIDEDFDNEAIDNDEIEEKNSNGVIVDDQQNTANNKTSIKQQQIVEKQPSQGQDEYLDEEYEDIVDDNDDQ
eukprot:403376297